MGDGSGAASRLPLGCFELLILNQKELLLTYLIAAPFVVRLHYFACYRVDHLLTKTVARLSVYLAKRDALGG